MKNWFQRIFAILLLSAGLACVMVPFRDYRIIPEQMTVASANAVGLVKAPDPLWSPDAREVNNFPAEILATLDDETFTDTKTLRLPGENVALFFPPDSFEVARSSFHLLYRERLFEIRNQVGYHVKFAEKYGSQPPTDLPEIIHITALGKLFPSDSGIAITDRSLKKQPALRSLLDRRVTESLLPFKSWTEFAGPGQTRAVFDGRLFEIKPVERFVDVKREVAGLRTKRLITGGGAILVGLILLIGLYRQKSGMENAIQIGTPGQQIAGDAIVIAIGAVAAIPWLDAFLHRSFGVETIADEEFGRAMGAFYLVVGVPCVALYLSMIGSQWLVINREGIRLRSLMSDRSIQWDDLKSIDSVKSHIGTVKSGIPMARTLQKSLVFLSTKQDRIAVMEPSEGVKMTILAQLEHHAPEEWKTSLDSVRGKWSGYESW